MSISPDQKLIVSCLIFLGNNHVASVWHASAELWVLWHDIFISDINEIWSGALLPFPQDFPKTIVKTTAWGKPKDAGGPRTIAYLTTILSWRWEYDRANKECDPQVNGIYGCLGDGRSTQAPTKKENYRTHILLMPQSVQWIAKCCTILRLHW